MSQKNSSSPLKLRQKFVRKIRSLSRSRVSKLDDGPTFYFNEYDYNPEISPSFKLTVTTSSESVACNRLPTFQTDYSLRCRFCNMKRCSTSESFGFAISPIAKVVTGTSLVDSVFINSPAEKSGLMSGDRILSVNGKRVSDNTDVDNLVKDDLDVELAVARAERGSDNELDKVNQCSKKSNKNGEGASCAKSCKNCASGSKPSSSGGQTKKNKTEYKYPENGEDRNHQFTWGTGTILDRYPEARAMLRMLGRGPYSNDLTDYGWSSY